MGIGRLERKRMKKYLLLIEDEKLWEKFKEMNERNINDEIFKLIKEKVEGKSKRGGKNND